MKLALTWPSGFRSAICSTLGSAPESDIGAATAADSLPERSSGGIGKFIAGFASNPSRCANGRSGPTLSSKLPAVAAPDPGSIGISARGGPGGTATAPPATNPGGGASAKYGPPFDEPGAAAPTPAVAARAAGNPGM